MALTELEKQYITAAVRNYTPNELAETASRLFAGNAASPAQAVLKKAFEAGVRGQMGLGGSDIGLIEINNELVEAFAGENSEKRKSERSTQMLIQQLMADGLMDFDDYQAARDNAGSAYERGLLAKAAIEELKQDFAQLENGETDWLQAGQDTGWLTAGEAQTLTQEEARKLIARRLEEAGVIPGKNSEDGKLAYLVRASEDFSSDIADLKRQQRAREAEVEGIEIQIVVLSNLSEALGRAANIEDDAQRAAAVADIKTQWSEETTALAEEASPEMLNQVQSETQEELTVLEKRKAEAIEEGNVLGEQIQELDPEGTFSRLDQDAAADDFAAGLFGDEEPETVPVEVDEHGRPVAAATAVVSGQAFTSPSEAPSRPSGLTHASFNPAADGAEREETSVPEHSDESAPVESTPENGLDLNTNP